MAEATRDMVTETDAGGRFTYLSAACLDVLGYEPDALVGTQPLELHHPDDVEGFRSELREGARSERPFQVAPHRLRHRDGSWVWVEATGVVYREPGGESRTIGVARDISARLIAEEERRELDERMRRSQKLESLGILAGGVAHDFNNLLTPIVGNASLALLDLPDGSPVRRRIEMIREAASRAAALTSQMLAFVGQGVSHTVALDISKLVADMVLVLEATTENAGAIVYELSPTLPPVEADATQIGQVVMNLVSNASESLPPEEGRIVIRSLVVRADRQQLDRCYLGEECAAGDYVCLEVSDNGAGMDEETRARIFDPFFTTKFTGRGLGLAALLGIVRAHRGAVEIESRPAVGTRFRVLLPVCASVEQSATSPAVETAPLSEAVGTLLVVDDDEGARELVQSILDRAGFRAVAVASGAQAVEVFSKRGHEISGVVLDCTMPEMSGEATFDAIREIRPDARVIMISGYSQARAAEGLLARGLAGFVQKPFSPTDLLREVERLF